MRKDEFLLSPCFTFILCLLTCFLFSCITTERRRADIESVVERNSRVAGQLEATGERLDATIDSIRNRTRNIIERSKTIEDTTERLEYLFTSYESEVDRILREIDAIREQTREGEKTSYILHRIDNFVYSRARRPHRFEMPILYPDTVLA